MTVQAQAIATQLGNHWTGHSETDWSFYLERSDGLSLFARSDDANSSRRLTIKGSWGVLSDFLPAKGYEEAKNKISVSCFRSPDRIAKEISRRLLPCVVSAWEKATVAFKQFQEREKVNNKLTRKLADIVGEKELSNKGNSFIHYGNPWIECRIERAGDAVDLKLQGIKPEQAEAILRLLAQ